MKKYNFIVFAFAIVMGVLLYSCEDEEKIIYDPSTVVASQLTGPSTIVLDRDHETDNIDFTWTYAAYDIHVDPDYAMEFAVNDTTLELFNGDDDKYSMTIGDLNKILLNNLELNADEEVEVSFKIINTIGAHADDVFSNAITYTVTPYQTSFPPIYMTGEATGGWDWDSDRIIPSTAPNEYSTLAHFTNGGAFRFFAQPDWNPTSYNYPYFASGTVSNLFEDAGDGDNNFKFVGTTGWYRVTVNLKTFIVEMETAEEPLLFMTGSAVGGWDWSTNFVKMEFVQEGIWTSTTDFTNGGAFRFFAQQDWNPTSYNYPYFSSGSVSNLFEDAEDGDNNFKFVGTTGDFTVTVNLNDFIVIMEQ